MASKRPVRPARVASSRVRRRLPARRFGDHPLVADPGCAPERTVARQRLDPADQRDALLAGLDVLAILALTHVVATDWLASTADRPRCGPADRAVPGALVLKMPLMRTPTSTPKA